MGRIWADIKEYGMAGIIFVIYYFLVHLFRAAFCPFLNMTGIPCAGCGMTRAFLFVLRGEFARAAYINPMVYVLIGFVLYCGYFRYLKGSLFSGQDSLYLYEGECVGKAGAGLPNIDGKIIAYLRK